MAERGFNPGTAAAISIVLHVGGAAKSEGRSANSSQQKMCADVPYRMINKAVINRLNDTP